ncbi:glycosyltransferase family 9 protein [Ectothiorhodospiraceae bacterium WFHF3C12]|nr:glycosyltransferase family 9 protein [Ectothiorhodospiraceae bacterium WFHF3C12]
MFAHKNRFLPLTAPPESICLLRLSAIGDCCNLVPVVRALQDTWPETRISWVIGRIESRLLGDIPGVEFIPFDKSAGPAAMFGLRRQLRGRRFDVLLHLQSAIRASLTSLAVPARVRLGYDLGRAREQQWLFTNARTTANPRRHVVDGYFDQLRALGIEPGPLRWDIPIPDAARERVDGLLPDGPVLAISPCSSLRANNYRNWRMERYAAIADYAVERHGLHVVLTGGPTDFEREAARAVSEAASHPVTDLVGRTSLKELLALLERSVAVVCPDSGPAHMATAVGTPVLGLFATSNPERTGPYVGREWIVNRYPEAVERYLDSTVDAVRWGRRVRDPRAMDLITVDDVRQRLDAVMGAQ